MRSKRKLLFTTLSHTVEGCHFNAGVVVWQRAALMRACVSNLVFPMEDKGVYVLFRSSLDTWMPPLTVFGVKLLGIAVGYLYSTHSGCTDVVG